MTKCKHKLKRQRDCEDWPCQVSPGSTQRISLPLQRRGGPLTPKTTQTTTIQTGLQPPPRPGRHMAGENPESRPAFSRPRDIWEAFQNINLRTKWIKRFLNDTQTNDLEPLGRVKKKGRHQALECSSEKGRWHPKASTEATQSFNQLVKILNWHYMYFTTICVHTGPSSWWTCSNWTTRSLPFFYFSLQKLKNPGLCIPYYILRVQHPQQCPALVRGM